MAYQALYRSYRPQDFKSVAGQRHVVTTLQNAIKLNKVAHAYLFSGPRGTGKTSMAKIMAKALNCVHGPTTEPCNECEICKGITKGTISDIVEIDAASNNGVDEIRDLRDKVKYLPSECRYKVYIIDEVHMLSQGAFNALLKTLEEPPSHVIFILATTEPHKIPATILSRCQRFDFQSLDKADIVERLQYVLNAENIKATPEAVDLIAESSEGGMRDALSLLDQSISYSTDDVISEDDVLAVSGNISSQIILHMLKEALESNSAEVLKSLGEIISDGKEIPRIINDVIIFLRDALLAKIGSSNSLKSAYKTGEYQVFLAKISNEIIYKWLDILNDTLNNIKFTTQKRAYLELGLLKMADGHLNDYASLLGRVEALERQIALGVTVMPVQNNEPKINFTSNPEEILKYDKPTIANTEIENDASFIQIEDIAKIINAGNKQLKGLIEGIIKSEGNHFEILKSTAVGAVSNDGIILVTGNIASANRLMRSPYYDQALKIINQNNHFECLYCVPKDKWTEIINDFRAKLSLGGTVGNIVFNNVVIPVKKHIKENNVSLEDEIYNMFDHDLVNIKEE
jgi:DNA polymerase III, subunit gamma and tau